MHAYSFYSLIKDEKIPASEKYEKAKILIAEGGEDFQSAIDLGFHVAVKECCNDIAKLLIKHGANVNVTSAYRGTIITDALRLKNSEIVPVLIECGVNINTPTEMGGKKDMTPLMLAVDGGFIDTAKLLLEHGAEVNLKNHHGWSALFIASFQALRCDSYPMGLYVIDLLLEKGADVNTKDDRGNNALHFAAMYDRVDYAKKLVDYGIDINNKNSSGLNVLMDLCAKPGLKVFKYLIDMGLDVNAKTTNGLTALMIAAGSELPNHIELVKFLIDHGASINEKDVFGNNALKYALGNFDTEKADLLRKHGAKIGWFK